MNTVPEVHAKRVWSYTRSRLHRTCPRALYFYLNQERKTSKEARPVPLWALVGLAVHRAIAEGVERWRGKQVPDPRATTEAAETYIQNKWDSRERSIVEAVNGQLIDRNLVFILKRRARDSLRTFFRGVWPRFDSHEYVSHESLSSVDLRDVRVWVMVDLCTREPDGTLVVTDWKTGRGSPADEDALQLDAYAVWANERHEGSLEKIAVQFVNVRTASFSRRTPTQEALSRTMEIIRAEADSWMNSASRSSFRPIPEFEKCIACQYLQQCSYGQACVEQRIDP